MPEKAEASRLNKMQADGIVVDMPPCDALYLVAYLFEAGPTMPSAMGETPLSHSELESWQRNTGIHLQPWECRAMKRLSIEYMSEAQKATDPGRPAPYTSADLSQQTRDAVSKQVTNSMRSYFLAKGTK